jgi:hypothetical protein
MVLSGGVDMLDAIETICNHLSARTATLFLGQKIIVIALIMKKLDFHQMKKFVG